MNAGELTERITILRQGPDTDNGIETVPGELETYCTRWAKWRAARPTEVFENLGREAKASGTFWIRYDSDTAAISPTDKLTWQGRSFDIVGAEETVPRAEIQIVVAGNDDITLPDSEVVLDFSKSANSGLLALLFAEELAVPRTGGSLNFSEPSNSGLIAAIAA